MPGLHAASNVAVCARLRTSLLLAVEELLVEPVRLLLPAVDDLRVALQRVQVGVAQHFLDEPHVSAGYLEQRGRRRVPGHVGRLERPRAELPADLLDDVARACCGKPSLA